MRLNMRYFSRDKAAHTIAHNDISDALMKPISEYLVLFTVLGHCDLYKLSCFSPMFSELPAQSD